MDREGLLAIKEKTFPKLIEKAKNSDDFIVEDNEIRFKEEVESKQVRIVLKNYGLIDPSSIEEYIARGGYFSLDKALNHMNPSEIIDIVKESKIRGRGGAGFPTGIKWEGAYKQDVETKYVICNADEGDPGAYMDRSILEFDPHAVIEGMIIAGKAIGSHHGYVYVRAEYPNAVASLRHAIKEAKKNNLLGENILGTGFDFDLQIRLGAGAFVCGEGTALIQSIEGNRGMPQAKVYRTNVRGLFDKPTIINNVETLANIAQIIEKGADWFKSYGTEDSPGTKVFTLVGKIKNAGLIEVPMGLTINEIVYEIGGGTADGKKIKAIQTGGPSGGCIPPELFDTPVDFISLTQIGSIMGSGGIVVMDESDCMVDIAKFFMKFTVDESCGKCTPCRIGNIRVLETLNRISEGRSSMEEFELLAELCDVITDTSLCGLGKAATNPVKSSMQYFKDEYIDHIENHSCKAGVCKGLVEYFITDKCIGCGKCRRECPVEAISGKTRQRHIIDPKKCIKCNNCLEVCPVSAVIRQ